MLNITAPAADRLEQINKNPDYADKALLLSVKRGPAGRRTLARFVDRGGLKDAERQSESSFPLFIDSSSARDLQDATLSYDAKGNGGIFHVQSNTDETDETLNELRAVIETKVNPQIRSYGGFVALLEVKDDTAYIHYGASCPGCSPNVPPTIKRRVVTQMQSAVPGIARVLDTSQSAGGSNPYFRA